MAPIGRHGLLLLFLLPFIGIAAATLGNACSTDGDCGTNQECNTTCRCVANHTADESGECIIPEDLSNLTVAVAAVSPGEPSVFNISWETGTEVTVFVVYGDMYLQEAYCGANNSVQLSHVYDNGTGSYSVTVRALNVLRYLLVNTVAEVDMPFAQPTLDAQHTEVGNEAQFVVDNMGGATRVTLFMVFGDQYLKEIFLPEATQYTIKHNYTNASDYSVSLHISNTRDFFLLNATLGYNEPIQNLSLQVNDTALGQVTFYSITYVTGTQVKCWLDTQDGYIISGCYDDITPILMNHTYQSSGVYNLSLTCYNYVSSHNVYYEHTIQHGIENATLAIKDLFLEFGEELEFVVTADMADSASITIDYGDTYTETTCTQEGTGPINMTLNHTYCSTGSYLVSAFMFNKVSYAEGNFTVLVEHPVKNLTLETNDVSEVWEAVEFRILQGLPDPPTDAQIICLPGDGVTEISEAFIASSYETYNLTYTYSSYGDFNVNVTIFNNVSRMEINITVRVGLPVNDFNISATKTELPTGETVFFQISTDQGSNVTYVVDFGDGTQSELIVRNQSDSTLPDVTTVSHTYAASGNFTVSAVAKSGFGELNVTLNSVMFVMAGVRNLTAEANPQSLPDGVATLRVVPNPNEVPATSVFCMWNFGDGSPQIAYVGTIPESGHSIEHNYGTVGTYYASVYCMNAVSRSENMNITVEVDTPISNARGTPSVQAVQTNGELVLTVAVDKGSRINYTIDFDNGTTDSRQRLDHNCENSNLNFNIAYSVSGNYTVTVNLSNSVSNETFAVVLIVQDPVQAIELTGPSSVLYPPGDGNFTYSLVGGTRADDVFLDINYGDSVSSYQYVGNLQSNQGHPLSHTYGSSFTGQEINVTVTASNKVSSASDSLVFWLDEGISGLELKKLHDVGITDSESTFIVLYATGTGVYVNISYGDTGVNDTRQNGTSFKHTFTYPAVYTIEVSAINSVSSVSVSEEYVVQNKVENMKLNCDRYLASPTGALMATLTYTGAKRPTNATAVVDFGDGNEETKFLGFEVVSDSFINTFTQIRQYTVTANISNLVSSQRCTCVVDLVELIDGLNITLSVDGYELYDGQDKFAVGQQIQVDATVTRGSNITYSFNTLDNNVNGTTPSFTYTVTELSTSLTVTASNPVNSQTIQKTFTIDNNKVGLTTYKRSSEVVIKHTEVQFELEFEANIDNTMCIHIHINSSNGTDVDIVRGVDATTCTNFLPSLAANFFSTPASKYIKIPLTFANTADCLADITIYTSHGKIVREDPFTVNDVPCNDPAFTTRAQKGDTLANRVKFKRKDKVITDGSFYDVSIECDPKFFNETALVDQTWTLETNGGHPISFHGNNKNISRLVDGLEIPSYRLEYGIYKSTVLMEIREFPTKKATYSIYFEIEASDPVVKIANGLIRDVGIGKQLVLEAEKANDPDSDPTSPETIIYSWFCNQSGAGCFGNSPDTPFDNKNKTVVNTTSLTVNSTYTFTLKITVGSRSASAVQQVNILEGDPPEVQVKCKRNCKNKVNTHENLIMEASCKTDDCSFEWYQTGITPPGARSDLLGTNATHNFTTSSFEEGATYRVEVVATRNGRQARVSTDIVINEAPYGGSCTIEPTKGPALTLFQLKASGWNDENPAGLSYEYEYEQGGTNVTVFTDRPRLPAGFYPVRIYIKDEYKAAATCEMMVNVTEPTKEDLFKSIDELLSEDSSLKVLDSMATMVAISSSLGDPVGGTSGIGQTSGDGVSSGPGQTSDSGGTSGTGQTSGSGGTSGSGQTSGGEGTSGSGGEVQDPAYVSEEAKQKQEVVNKMMNQVNNIVSTTQKNQSGEPIILTSTQSVAIMSTVAVLTNDMTPTNSDDAMNTAISVVTGLTEGIDSLNELETNSYVESSCGVLSNVLSVLDRQDDIKKADANSAINNNDMKKRTGKALDAASAVMGMKMGALLDEGGEMSTGTDKLKITVKKVVSLENLVLSAQDRSIQFLGVSRRKRATAEKVYQITYSASNPYSWEDSSKDVNSGITILNVKDANGNDASVPNDLRVTLGPTSNIQFFNFSDSVISDQNMRYIKLNVTTIDQAYIMDFSLAVGENVDETTLDVYIKVNATQTSDARKDNLEKPTPDQHDFKGTVSAVLGWTLVVPEHVIYPGLVYIGIKRGNNETDGMNTTLPMFSLKTTLSCCRVWDGTTWTSENCKVDRSSDTGRVVCLCKKYEKNMRTFARGFSLPQVNTINFQYIFNNFGRLFLENPVVFATILSLFLLYFLLAIWARRKDRRDVEKWGVTGLIDNHPMHHYMYRVTVYTGIRNAAGTKSNICFIVTGDNGDSGTRRLKDSTDKTCTRGSVRSFVLTTMECLGPLSHITVWHDSSGKGEAASWFLDKFVVEDVAKRARYEFLCGRWLAVDEDDGEINRVLPVAGEEETTAFNHVFFTTARKNISDEHLWLSVLARPSKSNFTRLQRLTCCITLLFTTMLASAMWYRSEETVDADQAIVLGPLILSVSTLYISVMANLTVVPINLIIVQLFRKSKAKPPPGAQEIESKDPQPKEEETPGPTQRQSNMMFSHVDVGKVLFSKDKAMLSDPGTKMLPQTALDKILAARSLPGQSEVGAMPAKPLQPEYSNTKIEEDTEDEETKKKSNDKWWQQKYPLPYYCSYIAWALAILSILLSAFFVFFYSLQWGKIKSEAWLSSLFLSFFQSVVIMQPVKVIVIAMLFSCIFKKVDDDYDEEFRNNTKQENVNPAADEELMMEALLLDELPNSAATPIPPNRRKIERARQLREREKKMIGLMKEILFYFFFLIIISFIAWGSKENHIYNMTKALLDNLQGSSTTSLDKVKDGHAFWRWVHTGLIPSLAYTKRYDNSNTTKYERNFMADMASVRVGSIRMRQLRIKSETCGLTDHVRNLGMRCRGTYDMFSEDVQNFTVGWLAMAPADNTTDKLKLAYRYLNAMQLNGLPYWGEVAWYGGGGYVADLGVSPDSASVLAKQLQQNDWIDHLTRAVFVEYTIYNPSMNLFAYINGLLEFPSMGGVYPNPKVTIFRIYSTVGAMSTVVLSAQIIYVILIVYFVIVEAMRLRKQGRQYFKSLWNLLEVALLGLSITAIAMFALGEIWGRLTAKRFKEDKNAYINYMQLAAYHDAYNYVVAAIVFIANIKFLKLMRFNKHIAFLAETMSRSKKELFSFGIVFLIVFVAYACLGHLCFMLDMLSMSTFIRSMESLYSMLLGRSEFKDMAKADRIIGPIFFATFLVFVFFIIMHMFLSIIGTNYYLVRTDPSLVENDYEVVGYLWRRFKALFGFKDKKEDLGKGYVDPTKSLEDKVDQLSRFVNTAYVSPVRTEILMRRAKKSNAAK